MNKINFTPLKAVAGHIVLMAFSLVLIFTSPFQARADETDAKQILRAMSDYMAKTKSLSFEFDATLEIVTDDDQKIALASSGSLSLNRPDKIRVNRFGGFADIEMSYDGKTLSLLGKKMNLYTQLKIPGTIDHLVDELKDTYNRPLPAADLLLSNSYDALMHDVVNIKDLGTGVVGGVLCDSLAFRTNQVDWQIWIAQGDHPYPCRYVITSKQMSNGPQYSVQIRNWKTGSQVVKTDFTFKNITNAQKVDFKDLTETDELPGHFTKGKTK